MKNVDASFDRRIKVDMYFREFKKIAKLLRVKKI